MEELYMNKKLIFFDIDNTLIDHFNGGIVPKSTIDALFKLRANNHIVGIATGKGPQYIKRFLPEFAFNTFVSLNGNYVVLEDELIFSDSFESEEIKKFIDYCIINDYPLMCGDLDGTKTIWKDNEKIKNYYNYFNASYPKIIEDYLSLGSIHQMSVMVNPLEEAKVIKDFPNFTYARMNDYGINVNPPGGGKEKGLKEILAKTSYTIDDLVVFGDGLNDTGMFKLAQTSVALGNAADDLKTLASYISTPVYDDGVYKACLELDLI
jgi:Cof subfamily protein (haloacid dehalogenase superfamily)